ncbi:MAG: hypothetical protein ACKOUM_08250 [Sphingopyxis sp.]
MAQEDPAPPPPPAADMANDASAGPASTGGGDGRSSGSSDARGGRGPWRAVLRALLFAALALVLVAGAAALVLDSAVGRRFVTDRIEAMAPQSGLRVRVGRIEGSLYRDAVLRDVRLFDPQGQFLRVGEARLRWHPLDFVMRRRLSVDNLLIPRAELSRMPALRPADPDKPILPDFDIIIGQLAVNRLEIGADVAGRAHIATLSGRADIRSGTANIALNARLLDGDDRLKLALIAAPDRGEFDVDADVVAPRGGVLAAMAGANRGVNAIVRGQGNWAAWRGALLADSDGQPLARLRLGAQDGRYTATGRVHPQLFLTGLAQRALAGGVAVDAAGRWANRRWDGRVQLVGSAITLDGAGQVDLGRNRFSAWRMDGWLRQPGLLLERMDGQNLQFSVLLDGAFATPRYEYQASAPWLSFGTTRLSGVRASGSGLAARTLWQVPVAISVDSVTGVGAATQRIVRRLTARGVLQWQNGVLTSDLLALHADGLDGRATLIANFRTGDYAVGFDGAVRGVEVLGRGRVDL